MGEHRFKIGQRVCSIGDTDVLRVEALAHTQDGQAVYVAIRISDGFLTATFDNEVESVVA